MQLFILRVFKKQSQTEEAERWVEVSGREVNHTHVPGILLAL